MIMKDLVRAAAPALIVGALGGERAFAFASETYTLPNGMTVILHQDRRLPQVTVNIWYVVGSKDEAPGRSGFAHLFEHLMFMGTHRVPGNQFDVLMESGGGANNASTSNDKTSYYSWGPTSILPTLLWLDADRLDQLGDAMTQEKLDLQRDVVRNERRQTVENAPYGIAELILPEAMYPPGHPYRHPVIGSHEDLQAATLQDVKDFFATWYVPGNASLVVAGDFDPAAMKELIARTFGAIPAKPMPEHRDAPPIALEREVRRLATDKVENGKLFLVWPGPRAMTAEAAQLDLLARILADGSSSRLVERLVLDLKLAQNVDVYFDDLELGGEFHVHVLAAPGADLGAIKRETLAVLAGLQQDGPTAAELQRAKAMEETAFRRQTEDLNRRADMLNRYFHFFGTPDGFARDLARTTSATAEQVRDAARTLGEGRVDLRIVPQGAATKENALATRPGAAPAGHFAPPAAQRFTLSNGAEVAFIPVPGSGLFTGRAIFDGGERAVPPGEAGLAPLLATLLTSGAGGRDAAQFADAVQSLGAAMAAEGTRHALVVGVSGLSARLDPTLDLFADALLRPALAEPDFAREKALALARIGARAERPTQVAQLVALAGIFGPDDLRGRPAEGSAASVGGLTLAQLKAAYPALADPARARFVFAGDLDAATLKAALEARFGAARPAAGVSAPPPRPAALASVPGGKILLVDRPGAPQTVILLSRPVAPADEAGRGRRAILNTLFGGSFTSRLNQNLREDKGYTYGARSQFSQDGAQPMLVAMASVQTEVTAAALGEFKKEFAGLASGNVTAAEFAKARETAKHDLVEAVATTSSTAEVFAGFVVQERPLDALAKQLAALDAATLDAVNVDARSGLYDWNGLTGVLVGDAAAIVPQLEKAGFGTPQQVDLEGRPR
jgi:predicted Zn-dependent peptidase